MTATFMGNLEYITVAVGFDRHSAGLAAAAVRLCRRTGKKLCLLHVAPPWAELPVSRPFGEGDPLWDVTQAVERGGRDMAASKLAELAATLPKDVPVKCVVLTGKVTEHIAKKALEIGTCLLLVGADSENLRFLPRGFSTALSLLVTSPVPVAVFDTKHHAELFSDPAKLLLSDDLGPQSETAVEFAFGLASALGKSELHHVHVNGMSLATLQAGLETASAASHTPVATTTSAAGVYDALLANLNEKLNGRATTPRDYLEAAGGKYVAAVVTGNVSEQIIEVANAVQPDVLIFGRHHAYYTKPFFIGRLPYRSMLAQKRPIIVVPNE